MLDMSSTPDNHQNLTICSLWTDTINSDYYGEGQWEMRNLPKASTHAASGIKPQTFLISDPILPIYNSIGFLLPCQISLTAAAWTATTTVLFSPLTWTNNYQQLRKWVMSTQYGCSTVLPEL